MTYAFLAFVIGLLIGHKWALAGVYGDLTMLDKDFQKLKDEYQDALQSALLAERAYKQTIKEYEKLKKELEDTIK